MTRFVFVIVDVRVLSPYGTKQLWTIRYQSNIAETGNDIVTGSD